MSYCRWSCDNWKCDIYCYVCESGFVTHVAATRVVGLPHDGESFEDPDAESCANRLEALRGLGYNVPQYAIDQLRETDLSAGGAA